MKSVGGTSRWLVGLVATVPLALVLMNSAGSAPVTNAHFSPAGTVAIPGRGLSVTWSPSGDSIATGGHFVDKVTRQRYDTRVVSVRSMALAQSYDCHLWWTIAQAWQKNPYIGEVIADGGGDHAVKIWSAASTGTTKCKPGQFAAAPIGVHALYNINGWITALQFSPDGKYLAGTSRDRALRIWQIMPGPDQWKVVKVIYNKVGRNMLSVRWAPDGKRLIVGDRAGTVSEYAFDPTTDRWPEDLIAQFDKLAWAGMPTWFDKNPALVTQTPLWTDGGHKQVWNVRYSPDGNRVAATGGDGTLSVYQARTGHLLYRVQMPKKVTLNGLDWSPDGALIATGASNHNIYVYNANDGSLYDTLIGHATIVTAVAFSPNGKTLASTAGGPLLSEQLNPISVGPDDDVRLWTRH